MGIYAPAGFSATTIRSGGNVSRAKRAPGDGEATRAQERDVLPGGDEIGDDRAPAGGEHARDLGERPLALFARVDVVQAQVRHHDVDAAVGERERARVLVADLAVRRDALGADIGDGALERVAREIRLLEDVDADGASPRQSLGRADGKEAEAGADVEHGLAAAEAPEVEDAVAMVELADLGVEQHQAGRDHPRAAPDVETVDAEACERDLRDEDGEPAEPERGDDPGRVDAVIDARPGHD